MLKAVAQTEVISDGEAARLFERVFVVLVVHVHGVGLPAAAACYFVAVSEFVTAYLTVAASAVEHGAVEARKLGIVVLALLD